MNTAPSPPPSKDALRDKELAALLERFDPQLHGGEAMAFAPVGAEFGSPDYMAAQDAAGGL